MKIENIIHGLLALLLAASLSGGSILAQNIEVLVRGGTITEFAPGEQVIVHAGDEHLTYYWTEETVVLDAHGRIVGYEVLSDGIPATVEYRLIEGRPVAVRVVMAPVDVATEVLVATGRTVGTVAAVTPGERILVRTAEVAEPVEYVWVEETVIVDPDGQVLTREALREGISARVYYRDSEGRRVVDRVIVTGP